MCASKKEYSKGGPKKTCAIASPSWQRVSPFVVQCDLGMGNKFFFFGQGRYTKVSYLVIAVSLCGKSYLRHIWDVSGNTCKINIKKILDIFWICIGKYRTSIGIGCVLEYNTIPFLKYLGFIACQQTMYTTNALPGCQRNFCAQYNQVHQPVVAHQLSVLKWCLSFKLFKQSSDVEWEVK